MSIENYTDREIALQARVAELEVQMKQYGDDRARDALEMAINCYSPDDTAGDFIGKIQALKEIEVQQTELSDEEIDAIDQSMCGEREFHIPFARAVLAAQRSKLND